MTCKAKANADMVVGGGGLSPCSAHSRHLRVEVVFSQELHLLWVICASSSAEKKLQTLCLNTDSNNRLSNSDHLEAILYKYQQHIELFKTHISFPKIYVGKP